MKHFIRLVAASAVAMVCMMAVADAGPTTTATDAVRGIKPTNQVKPQFHKRLVRLATDEAPGTIIVDTNNKFLYLVEGNNRATRYGIGVGRDGFGWSGVVNVGRKAEWPTWTPPAEMRVREAKEGHKIPPFMPGGPDNPLGARAMYLYQNGHDTIFRIHGTNQPWTIGLNLSSGCIRMMNQDVTELYDRVPVGAKVIVVGPGNKQGEVSYQDRGVDVLRTLFGLGG
ncbi:L,D-transpeptidase [Neorhizobium sp. P12A]|uniref:L,D-transpeptidase n=1 Tax=Neorhizobium sp. P12A TaxID=2268027 RepID=UPI0011EEC061|nr:L,D-transpeptidase [Neorhizobium sp. P12A]KAA0699616.1 L,D-transpeptidase [Neorhizobium sp. P12A]